MKSYDFYPIVEMILKIFIYLLIGFFIFECISECGSGPSLNSSGEATIEVPQDAEFVTADDIFSDIGDNPIRAKEKYEGKWFRVRGLIYSIDEDGTSFDLRVMKDNPLFSLSVNAVDCDVYREKRGELKNVLINLNQGDDIVVLGKITNTSPGNCDLNVYDILIGNLGQLETSSVTNVNDNNELIEEKNKKIKSAFIKAYNDVVNSFDISDPIANMGFICEYFMYDITGDGIPEFWIKYGISEAGYQIRACAYDKDNRYKTIWEGSAGHTTFYEGNGYILRVYAHMGDAFWSKLSYNGNKIVESGTVFEENTEEIDDDGCISYREYTKPKEKYIDLYPFSNVEPMNRALGLN